MKSLSIFFQNTKAFTLLESIISIGIFVIFATAIYTSVQYVYKVVYSSRIQIIETAILNEQIEIIRNMDFLEVGIIGNEVQSGILTRTSTIIRDDVNFEIIRTIRYRDDPADGTAETGDIYPFDYKLIFLEVKCSSCLQTKPLTFSTYVADSFAESASSTGALFINVKDSNNNPVQGASVNVSSTEPTINIKRDDTTDNDGILRIYILPACYKCYKITVTKPGLTTDQTYSSDTFGGSTPVNENVTINDQQVSNVFLQIDTPTSMTLKTVNRECISVPDVNLTVNGGGIIANSSTVYYLNDIATTTNSSGENILDNLHWGEYNFAVNNYNFVGSIPNQPLNILANSSQVANVVVTTSTVSSLSVLVLDNNTHLPISDAQVTLTSGNDFVNYTGFGYNKQNEWLGVGGDVFYGINHGFWNISDAQYDIVNHPFGLKLSSVGLDLYTTSGNLESATFDFTTVDVSYTKIDWQPHDQSILTGIDSVSFQIATSPSFSPATWNFLGPDGTSGTYYNLASQDINGIHNGQRYFRYKLYLATADPAFTPVVSEVSIFYTKSCSLPGQVYFDTIPQSIGNTLRIDASAYNYEIKNITNITIDNNLTTTTYLTNLL